MNESVIHMPSLPVAGAALIAALVLLAIAVRAIARAARGVELARLPVAAHQDVVLPSAGRVVLHGEGRRFPSRFRGLEVRLVERATGIAVPQRRPLVHTTVAGWSLVRMTLQSFEIPRAGGYRLEVTGLAPEGRDEATFVFMPPTGARLPLAIVGAVIAAAGAVGALVVIGLTLADHAVLAPPLGGDATASLPRPEDEPAPSAAPRAGRQLRPPAAGALDGGREVTWRAAALTLRVPATWQMRASDDELDVRDPDHPSTYLVGHTVVFPPPTTAAMLAAVNQSGLAGRLQSGAIEGYAAVQYGSVAGLVTIESRGDGSARIASWSAFRPTLAGVENVIVLLGAAGADFDSLEPTFAAVLASARFARR